ncbi:MAG: hypothetical protein IRZ03_19040 [Acidobacterium ailaaui]|nr:hypothetical protein [Pseudacidobacterium ailaaui]
MSMRSYGFLSYESKWKHYYDDAERSGVLNEICQEVNVTEKQVYKILELLYENRIIN